jgi:hypothetical protein
MSPATVSAAWTGVTCMDVIELGDEFGNVDPASGLDVVTQVIGDGTGACTTTITPKHANEALWGSCYGDVFLTSTGAGFTLGADDHAGDWSEYRITRDGAGTIESLGFSSTPDRYVFAAAALAPAPR